MGLIVRRKVGDSLLIGVAMITIGELVPFGCRLTIQGVDTPVRDAVLVFRAPVPIPEAGRDVEVQLYELRNAMAVLRVVAPGLLILRTGEEPR